MNIKEYFLWILLSLQGDMDEAKWIGLWFRDKICPGGSVLKQRRSSLQESVARAEKLIGLKHNLLMLLITMEKQTKKKN